MMNLMNEVFHISGMKYRGKIVLAGTRDKGELPRSVIKKIKRVFNNTEEK